jgi:hypothetical protein
VRPEPKKKNLNGVYLPDGNVLERLGHCVARVLSAGEGYYVEREGREVFEPSMVKPGDRVVLRGHLSKANEVGKDCCFIHHRDLMGVLDEGAELGMALPYDN